MTTLTSLCRCLAELTVCAVVTAHSITMLLFMAKYIGKGIFG